MTTLESAPLEDVLSDVLDGVVVIKNGAQLEDLTTRQLAIVMVRIQRMRHDKITEVKELAEAAAEAKADAVKAHARAFLAHDGQPTERTQVAKLAAAEAEFKADVAKAALDACKAAMDLLKDDWDTARSINANERAEKSAIEGWGS